MEVEKKMMSSAIQNRFPAAPHGSARKRAAARAIVTCTVLALAGVAVGCSSFQRDHVVVGSVPDDYRTRHPIVVSQNEISEDIVVPSDARTLSPRDRSVVEAFASRFRRSGTKSLAIMIPSGSHNETAAKHIAYEAAKVMQERGVPRTQIQIQHYAAAGFGEAATLRLVYADITASVPSRCGSWNEDLHNTLENRNYDNFGCATQTNLAAIVANPADLLGPRGESEIDATRRTTVIENWREEGTPDLADLELGR